MRVTYIFKLIPKTAVCSVSSKKPWTFFLPTFAVVCMFYDLHIHSLFLIKQSLKWETEIASLCYLTIFALFFCLSRSRSGRLCNSLINCLNSFGGLTVIIKLIFHFIWKNDQVLQWSNDIFVYFCMLPDIVS